MRRLLDLPGMSLLKSIDRELKAGLYIVGGAVRDAVLGRTVRDIDIIVQGDARRIASMLSRRGPFPFVRLDESRGMYRVVPSADFAIDFVPFQGSTLEEDLLKRDFTINAMACAVSSLGEKSTPPSAGECAGVIIDPCNGRDDCKNRTIRAVSESAFDDDPLRMVRACRFMAELDFRVASDIPAAISVNRQKLGAVAQERILHELSILLDGPAFGPALSLIERTGLLHTIFDTIGIHLPISQDRVELTFTPVVTETHHLVTRLKELNSDVGRFLARRLEQRIDGGISLQALLRLSCLMPRTGEVREMERAWKRLTMSRAAIRSLRAWFFACHDGEKRFPHYQATERELRSYLFEHGEDGLWGMVIDVANRTAASPDLRDCRSPGILLGRLCALILLPDPARDELMRVVSGHFVQSITGIPPGPDLGCVLSRVQHDIYVGLLRTEAEVLECLASMKEPN